MTELKGAITSQSSMALVRPVCNRLHQIKIPYLCLVGVDVQTGTVFPGSFVNRGPDVDLRKARIFTGSDEV